MAIVHRLDAQGGFTVGDTESRITAYSYPTSFYSTAAKRSKATADRTAENMVEIESHSRYGFPHEAESDARNWLRLTSPT